MFRARLSLSVTSASLLLLLSLLLGCEPTSKAPAQETAGTTPKPPVTITLGAYTTPREAYGKSILPAFQAKFRAETGVEVKFNESYLGSGAQARAIIGGFEADVAALSLEPDIQKLVEAGLVSPDWKKASHGAMVTRSIVVIGVRQGNPKNIRDWKDLARPGINVLTPNVRTSGGAMWNVMAIYGAATRGQDRTSQTSQDAAVALIGSILGNVKIMDRGARESLLTFERGVGDAIITYENEILLGRLEGKAYDYIVPASTVLIENPLTLVSSSVDRHNNRAAAQAFIDFLFTPEAQHAFAKYGLRPAVASVAQATQEQFAPVDDLFTITDLGGWATVQKLLFDQGGVYDRAVSQSTKNKP